MDLDFRSLLHECSSSSRRYGNTNAKRSQSRSPTSFPKYLRQDWIVSLPKTTSTTYQKLKLT